MSFDGGLAAGVIGGGDVEGVEATRDGEGGVVVRSAWVG